MPMTVLGLTITQTLVVLGAILFIIDLFFLSDIFTIAAYCAFAAAITVQFSYPPLVQVLVGLLAFVGLVIFHYAVWRGILRRFSERLAPAKFHNSVERVVGQRGTIRHMEGRSFVSIAGELWSLEPGQSFAEGTVVEVVGRAESLLNVRPVSERTHHTQE